MKVSLIMPTLDVGGVERVMLYLAQGFLQKGLSVDLIVADATGPLRKEVPPGVTLFDLKTPRVLWSIPRLVVYFRRYRPDAVISAKDYQNLAVILAVKLAGIRSTLVATTHIDVSVDWQQGKGLKSKLIPYLVRYFYLWADHVVTVSQGARNNLLKKTGLPAEKVRTIYNPVVTPEVLLKVNEPVDHLWFRTGEVPVILSVGRLTQQKDYTTLIKAFALVRQRKEARLVILGEGEERPVLEKLTKQLGIQEDVSLPGFVENPYPYMARAAVFVLSSKWEGLPTVLIEALACGCPVVATDCPSGPSEILEGGRWGLLVPVGDEVALAQAIIETLERPPNRESLRKRGLEFSLEGALQNYLNLIHQGENR